jgi:hypothetical protein
MPYHSLNDPVIPHNDARMFYKGPMLAKFCSMGFVSSSKWFPCYITIYDSILRLYDDEETATRNPSNSVLQIVLDDKRRPSTWKLKNYSKVSGKIINFYTFYILKDSAALGLLSFKRKLKLGSLDLDVIDQLIRCIELNTQNKSTDVLRN